MSQQPNSLQKMQVKTRGGNKPFREIFSPSISLTSNVRQTSRLSRIFLRSAVVVVVQGVLLTKPRSANSFRLLLLLAQVVPRDQLARRVQARGERVGGFCTVVFICNINESLLVIYDAVLLWMFMHSFITFFK